MLERRVEDVFTPNELQDLRMCGSFTTDIDLRVVCAFARRACLDGGMVLELGTAFGETARAIADATPSAFVFTCGLHQGSPGMAAVDPGARHETPTREQFARACVGHTRIEVLEADTRHVSFEPLFNRCPMVFVDADHRWEGVRRDTIHAAKVVECVGYIVWHDYPQMPPVRRFLDRISADGQLGVFHIEGTQIAALILRGTADRVRLLTAAQMATE